MTLSSYRVLIVDDNPVFVKTLSTLIENVLGSKLTQLDVAYNGKDAVELAFQEDFYTIIFMDVNMPEMNGIEATKIITKSLYRETKVVAVSFNKDIDTLDRMFQSGASCFLYKDKLTIESLENIFDVRLV